ncbi:MAG TPA: class I tRNA ligase family protein, partial [Planctomycetota bacterium]|nr:class I tRNA ligase family protein [Planctomycetota bacterium]
TPASSENADGDSEARRAREGCPTCGGAAKPEPGRILSWVGETLLLYQVPSGPVPPFPELDRSSSATDGAKELEVEMPEARPSVEDRPRRAAGGGERELEDEGAAVGDGFELDDAEFESAGDASSDSEAAAPDAGEADDAFDSESADEGLGEDAPDRREAAALDAAGEISVGDEHDGDGEDRPERPEGDIGPTDELEDDASLRELDDDGAPRHPRTSDEENEESGAEPDGEETRAGRKRDRRRRPGRRVPETDEEPEDDEPIDGNDLDERARRRIDPSAFESLRGPEGERFAPFRNERLRPLFPADIVLAPGALRTRAIIATRFVTKFLYDLRLVPSFEPFRRFFRVGDLVISNARPREATGSFAQASTLDLIEAFGGDAFRMAAIALGPPESRGVLGFCELNARARCLDRIFRLVTRRLEKGRFVSRRVLVAKHVLIQKVTDRLRRMRFHTALSAIDEFVRFLRCETTEEEVDRSALETFAIVLSPFAPYLAQELWSMLGHKDSVAEAKWPEPSAELLASAEREIPVWVDGRVRDRMPRPADEPAEALEADALARDAVRRVLGGRAVERVIAVPGRFVSIVGRAEEATIEAKEQG